MKNVVDETVKLLNEEELLYEMSNIQPRTTGLKSQLYATFDGEHLCPHGPRVKVRTKTFPKGFPIIINRKTNKVYPLNKNGEYSKLQDDDRKVVDEALPYIIKNKDIFLTHWNAVIGDEQLRKVLKGEFTLEQAKQDAKENGVE